MFKCPFCGAEFLTLQYYNEHVLKCPYQFGKPKKESKKHEPKVEKEIEEKVEK